MLPPDEYDKWEEEEIRKYSPPNRILKGNYTYDDEEATRLGYEDDDDDDDDDFEHLETDQTQIPDDDDDDDYEHLETNQTQMTNKTQVTNYTKNDTAPD